MKLNVKKSCGMIFNFTQNYQFNSRIKIEGQPLQLVNETKLLGLILRIDMQRSSNTDYLVKKANARMEILRRLANFSAPIKDMVQIYITYIRSILEQSCVIWHNSITEEDNMKLERVQKNACRNILKEKYESYENSLRVLSIDTLFERRKKLFLAFGRKCLKLDQTKDLFPLNENLDTIKLRTRGKYKITETNTERFKNSTVPCIQRMLNEKE
jgi:hypothetical protein